MLLVVSYYFVSGGPVQGTARSGRFLEERTNTMDTVLVVEDSRAMQRTLKRLFESDSLHVQIAPEA